MFLKSLQWRLVLIITAVTITVMIFVGMFLNEQAQTNYYGSFKTSIDEGFGNWNFPEDSNLEQLKEYLSSSKAATMYFGINESYKSYAILDMGGNIKYASGTKYSNREIRYQNEILSSKNLLEVMKGAKISTDKKAIRIGDSIYFDYASRIKLSDGEYILYFRYDREAWGQIIQSFNWVILKCLLLGIFITILVGYLLAKTITKPIETIMLKAEKIAKGDFGELLDVKSDDEIGNLTATFNYMSGTLKNTLSEVYNEKSKMETVLQYMTDGVLAFNMKGEMIVSNQCAKLLLGISENDMPDFNSLSERLALDLKIEEFEFLDDLSVKEKSIFTNERYLRLYFATIAGEKLKLGGIVVVLQDYTEQEKLENMRREFVANVSHELRTPLTSIKSYAETLLDGAIEDRETSMKFLGVIESESDRMTRLVKDLLQLSRLDNQQMQWNMREVNFLTLVKSCVEKMQIEARNKKHNLKCFAIGDVPNIIGDSDRIEQIVINIINNAIKYTHDGGEITVYVGRHYSEVYAKISDTGIGIPKEDLPRIFERFYRVDKARSRDMGGTGLGLAIAKEITEAHGGSINIASEKDKGTEVTVSLPIKH